MFSERQELNFEIPYYLRVYELRASDGWQMGQDSIRGGSDELKVSTVTAQRESRTN
jgi:hypothetical protein